MKLDRFLGPSLVSLCVSLIVPAASPADAKTLCVNPGGTAGCLASIQAAVDAAAPKDVIRIKGGTYAEAVTVNKQLKIYGGAVIEAGCVAAAAITVAADGVLLDNLFVRGGTVSSVDVTGRDRVTLNRIQARPGCAGVQYGIHASNTTRLLVKEGSFRSQYVGQFGLESGHCPPFQPSRDYAIAAVYVGQTPAGARNKLLSVATCAGETTGIQLTDTQSAPTGPPAVTVLGTVTVSTRRGIFLNDSRGVAVRSSLLLDGFGTGIEVDSGSDDNVLAQNEVSGFAPDVSDAGDSNCWRNNTFTTGTVPSTGCP